MKKPPAERRSVPRIRAEFPATINSTSGRQKARIRDLSNKGVCFFLDDPIAEMTAVRIDLELPLAGTTQSVSGDGAVVRCNRIATGVEHYEIAVFFTYLEDGGKETIDQFISLRA